MPTVHVERRLSITEMLKAAQQLSVRELGQFLAEAFALWAERQNPRLTTGEKKLLQKIQQPIPEELRKRYRALIQKLQAETLTPTEHKELLRLTRRVEAGDVSRLRTLIKLAEKRGTSLTGLMEDLGIGDPEDD